ncbi:Vmc-like lipoprotein signal peptide domain-containing protein [Spiroplasma sp. BIUS-1]|uniref:Vmc-like lipoprotein signal peptide domain-containing protein n=1 Tax=Spiroplasma sp. BIUS-1 TaxID=216964 RepID=UPI0013984104|nr:hypothetical protein [Spiroplasma sp. BIUS-1]QHX36610.1 hypothetical protein SBIUS_v1c03570 [Spiroplasma sp. BIUS-1]
MKKLLGMLGSALFVVSSIGTVVSCGEVVIKKEKLKTIDQNFLMWSTNSFYWNKLQSNQNCSIEDMVDFFNKDYNKEKNIIPDGIMSIEASKKDTDDEIIIKSNVYSNYKQNEDVVIYYSSNPKTIDVSNIFKQSIQSYFDSEKRYNFLDDAQISFGKAVLSQNTFLLEDKKTELEQFVAKNNWGNSDSMMKIDVINGTWSLDTTKLQPFLNTKQGYVFAEKELSGTINIKQSSQEVDKLLNGKIQDYYSNSGWVNNFIINYNNTQIFTQGTLGFGPNSLKDKTLSDVYTQIINTVKANSSVTLTDKDEEQIFSDLFALFKDMYINPPLNIIDSKVIGTENIKMTVTVQAYQVGEQNNNFEAFKDIEFKEIETIQKGNGSNTFKVYTFRQNEKEISYSNYRHNVKG